MGRLNSILRAVAIIIAVSCTSAAITCPVFAQSEAGSTQADAGETVAPPAASQAAVSNSGMEIDPRVLKAVNDYGPFAVLFLLVMPLMGEDIIIIPAGFLIGQGHLPWWSTFFCAWAGAMFSDGLWYFACYRFGTPLLHKKWFKRLAHPRRLLQAKHQIEQRGAWLIVTARFVPGSRTSTMIVAGLMHMAPWKYCLTNGLLLLVTVAMQLGLGWLVAHHIVGNARGLTLIMTLVGLILMLLLGAFVLNWYLSSRNSLDRLPRSKVTWLKRFRSPPSRRVAKSLKTNQ